MDSQPVRADRRYVFVAARMTVAGEQLPVTIANGSADGLLLRCDSPPAVGERIEVERGAARVNGEVIWRRGRRFGLRSEDALDLDALFVELPTPPEQLILAKADRAKSRLAWPARGR